MMEVDWNIIFSTIALICTLAGCSYWMGIKMQSMRGDIDANETMIGMHHDRIDRLEKFHSG